MPVGSMAGQIESGMKKSMSEQIVAKCRIFEKIKK
jgi:hypothetical protein